jgi:hypothetical protein
MPTVGVCHWKKGCVITEDPFAIGWVTLEMTDIDSSAIWRDISNAAEF